MIRIRRAREPALQIHDVFSSIKLAIRNFLENLLLLDAENAEKNACRMEHAMDKNAIDRLVQF
jgi:Mn-dependent DtxR family transcriptional regulator